MVSLDFVPIVLSAITFIAAAITWYRGAIQKSYAAERDFGHLKRSIDQLSSNMADGLRENDHRLELIERDLLEIKAALNVLLRGKGEGSGFFGRG